MLSISLFAEVIRGNRVAINISPLSGDDSVHILERTNRRTFGAKQVAGLRNSGDSLKLAHAVRHLGDAYYYAGQRELAEPCYVEALSIYRSRTDRRPLDLANAIRSYAVIKAELGATNEAKSLWHEAHDLYVSVEVHAGVAESAARLALLAQRENDLRQSREWLAEATRAPRVANDPETSPFVAEVKERLDAS